VEDLLNEVFPLTRVDIPDVLRWKAKALYGSGRINEAHQVLTEACSLAGKSGANLHLWPVLTDLAEVNSELGNHKEAEDNRKETRRIIQQIAESLHEAGLSESFLNQPRVQKLRR